MTKLLTDTSYGSGFGGHDDLVETYALTPGHPGYIDILDNGYETWPVHHLIAHALEAAALIPSMLCADALTVTDALHHESTD